MPTPPAAAATSSRVLHALDKALDQSHDVKAEVEACAEDLGSANDVAKARIADGATTLPAAQALRTGLAVKQRVQGCADDLQQVTDNLAHGLDEVKAVEQALSHSRMELAESETALAESEAALALSRSAEHTASQLAMHDQKTCLPNRMLFDDRLAQALHARDEDTVRRNGGDEFLYLLEFFEPPMAPGLAQQQTDWHT